MFRLVYTMISAELPLVPLERNTRTLPDGGVFANNEILVEIQLIFRAGKVPLVTQDRITSGTLPDQNMS